MPIVPIFLLASATKNAVFFFHTVYIWKKKYL